MKSKQVRQAAAILGASALVLTACAADDDAEFDLGVTEEPCPDAVNSDNGCIYLGVLSDLTEGPFSPVAVPLTNGQIAFWDRVNEAGGIGGFDIDVTTYQRDTFFDPAEHSSRYREIEPNILALAQSLGTVQTAGILADMDSDNVVAAPATWWSGWSFDDADSGLVVESGYSYCLESMVGLDWFASERSQPSTVMAIGYPGDYGGDSAAGAEHWAGENGADFVGAVETAPNAVVGSQDGPISQVLTNSPDVVILATGPAEAAEIVGGSVAQGFTGQFLGSVPTWNVALMASPAAPALMAAYTNIAPWEGSTGETPAHEAIQEALGGNIPDNDAYIFGWVWSYPMKALLEAAAEDGDLTREGLRAAVDGLEVDYEGILPATTFGGDPNDRVSRTATISMPDPDAQLGLTPLEVDYTGPTADAYDYSAPCAAA